MIDMEFKRAEWSEDLLSVEGWERFCRSREQWLETIPGVLTAHVSVLPISARCVLTCSQVTTTEDKDLIAWLEHHKVNVCNAERPNWVYDVLLPQEVWDELVDAHLGCD